MIMISYIFETNNLKFTDLIKSNLNQLIQFISIHLNINSIKNCIKLQHLLQIAIHMTSNMKYDLISLDLITTQITSYQKASKLFTGSWLGIQHANPGDLVAS